MVSKNRDTVKQRPLSPHLQVYKPQITSVLSILHRFSGLALSLSLVVVTFLVFSLAFPHNSFLSLKSLTTCFLVKAILWGGVLAFIYHFYSGLRHLLWDTGRLLSLFWVRVTGYCVIGLTVITFIAVINYIYGGGLNAA